jgi:hypothetical protein
VAAGKRREKHIASLSVLRRGRKGWNHNYSASQSQLRWTWETVNWYFVNATCGRVNFARTVLSQETSLLASASVRTTQIDPRLHSSLAVRPTHHRSYRMPSTPACCPLRPPCTANSKLALLPACRTNSLAAYRDPRSLATGALLTSVTRFRLQPQRPNPATHRRQSQASASHAGCSSPAERQSGARPHLLASNGSFLHESEPGDPLSRSVAMSATALSS